MDSEDVDLGRESTTTTLLNQHASLYWETSIGLIPQSHFSLQQTENIMENHNRSKCRDHVIMWGLDPTGLSAAQLRNNSGRRGAE